MLRVLVLVVDLSRSMKDVDLHPNRLAVTLRHVETFILEFFDQNPISQMAIVGMRDGVALRISDLSGNASRHIKALKSNCDIAGDMSLQNALDVAETCLRHVPKHASREVLMIVSGLTSVDPGDVQTTINAVASDGVRVSLVGLAAESFLCTVIARKCHGEYRIPVDAEHFRDILLHFTQPPPTVDGTTGKEASLVRMGFPKKKTSAAVSLCACHGKLSNAGFACPQCASKTCELPTECSVCSLALISSPHLARSYHHLFPIAHFVERTPAARADAAIKAIEDRPPAASCFACQSALGGEHTMVLTCPRCRHDFCSDCDMYVHEALHNCPGCQSRPSRADDAE